MSPRYDRLIGSLARVDGGRVVGSDSDLDSAVEQLVLESLSSLKVEVQLAGSLLRGLERLGTVDDRP